MLASIVQLPSYFSMCISYRKSACIVCAVLICVLNGNAANIKQDVVEETQHAVCNISTKDVQTSANASVTRQLKGVCTSKHLDLRFKQLEDKIIKELNIIKKMLSQMPSERSLDLSDPYSTVISPEYSDNIDSARELEGDDEIQEALPIFTSFKTTKIENENAEDDQPLLIPTEKKSDTNKPPRLSKEKKSQSQNQKHSTMNLDRMMHLNDTTQKTGKTNVYYYFWKVEDFNKLLKKSDMYKASPSFLVLGHELDIQIFPNQPLENYLTIKLRADRSFLKKHKFLILKRTSTGENINSVILGMNPKGSDKFSVTIRSIKNSECLKEDSIIIELNIYL